YDLVLGDTASQLDQPTRRGTHRRGAKRRAPQSALETGRRSPARRRATRSRSRDGSREPQATSAQEATRTCGDAKKAGGRADGSHEGRNPLALWLNEPVLTESQRPKRPSSTRFLLLSLGSLLLGFGLWQVLRAGSLPFLPKDVDPLSIGVENLLVYSVIWWVVLFFKAWRWRFQLAPVERVAFGRIL